jgi:hypothetical protein
MTSDPYLIPEENWTTQHRNLAKSLTTLLDDLDYLGWDQPIGFYALTDDADDPTLKLKGKCFGDPASALIMIYNAGFRVEEEALGLAVVHEAYRHLTFDELHATHPDAIESLVDAMKIDGIEVPEDDVLNACQNYYYNSVIHILPPPSELPDDMSKASRIVGAVLRDGCCLTVSRARGETKAEVNFWDKCEDMGLYPKMLYLFLHGLQPDPDCELPLQAVADFKVLQGMDL